MGLIVTLLVGLVVGAVAKFFMPGKDPGGIIITSLLGIGGAAAAGALGNALGWYRLGDGPGLVASVLGAMLLLFLYRLVTGRSRSVWR
jgi:uncharacterized membrane protein YeaQ/YmgE (transglycosylase-associated protein family)